MGKWWFRPNEEPLKFTGSDHGHVARLAMLGIKRGTPAAHRYSKGREWAKPLSREFGIELLEQGADSGVIAWLEDGKDPRLYVAQFWNWVRVHNNRMELWKFDAPTLKSIQSAVDYWRDEGKSYGSIQISELSTGDLFMVPVRNLIRLGVEPGKLRHVGLGVGRFLNPVDDELNELKIAFAFRSAGYPVQSVDTGSGDLQVTFVGGRQRKRPLPSHAERYLFNDWREYAGSVMT